MMRTLNHFGAGRMTLDFQRLLISHCFVKALSCECWKQAEHVVDASLIHTSSEHYL